MSWTVARDWTTGELISAAIMNSAVRDNLNALNPGGLTIDLTGNGAVITTGSYTRFEMPFSVCAQRATLIAPGQPSTLQISLCKAPYASLLSPSLISGASPPTLCAASTVQMTSLSTWTAQWDQGDWIVVNVVGCSGITRAQLGLWWNRI